MWGISITMCYFHRFIDDINYSLQDFLITFFELLAWIVLIIGAIYYGRIYISNPFFYRTNKHTRDYLM